MRQDNRTCYHCVRLFPDYVTFMVSLSIHRLFVCKVATNSRTADFNPNHPVCVACVCCRQMSQTCKVNTHLRTPRPNTPPPSYTFSFQALFFFLSSETVPSASIRIYPINSTRTFRNRIFGP